MDHGSVGLVPRIYGVRDYMEADPAAKKPLHTKRWQVGKHMPFTLVFRFQRVVMCVNISGTQQLDRLQVF